jgi:hypothetical protein
LNSDYNWFKVDSGSDTPAGDHWIARSLNLEKLYKLLKSFYSEKALEIENFPGVNIRNIAEHGDQHETLKLCKLVLFIAYHVDPKLLLGLSEETEAILKSIVETYQTYENQEE